MARGFMERLAGIVAERGAKPGAGRIPLSALAARPEPFRPPPHEIPSGGWTNEEALDAACAAALRLAAELSAGTTGRPQSSTSAFPSFFRPAPPDIEAGGDAHARPAPTERPPGFDPAGADAVVSNAKAEHSTCMDGRIKTCLSVPYAALVPGGPEALMSWGWETGAGARLLTCRGCFECQSVRIDLSAPFGRKERRALGRAGFASAHWSRPKALDDEHAALLARYATDRRGTTRGNLDFILGRRGVESTALLSLRGTDGALRAFLVLGLHTGGAAMGILHAYDPDLPGSPGTAAIAAACLELAQAGWSHLYIGDTGMGRLSYKAGFAGSEVLGTRGWERAACR